MSRPDNPLPSDIPPSEAIQIAYGWGAALHAAGANQIALPDALADYVNIPYGNSPLKRYLRIGFSAGYLGLPAPETARVAARCNAEDQRRKPRAPSSAIRQSEDTQKQEQTSKA